MKKKFLFLSALAAASTAFIGCSSDENLAEVPEVIEEPAPEPEPQGTPITVMLNNGGTRADLTTTVADLQSFKLWGIHNNARQINGAVFTGNNTDGWTATGANWPTTNKFIATSFYGYADYSDLSSADPTGLTDVNIDQNGQSFHYSLGDGESSTVYYSQYTQAIIDEYDPDGSNGLVALREDLKSTEEVYNVQDVTSMPTDLLVTADGLEETEEGNSGKLDVTLQHALSNLIIKAKFTTSTSGETWAPGWTYYIEWIRIHGLYTSGTYTFGSGWSVDTDTDGQVVYQKFFGEGVEGGAMPVTIQDHTKIASDGVAYTTLIPAGEFMVIPQDYSARAWEPDGSTAPSGCYIEFYGFIQYSDGSTTSFVDENHFLPLKITNNVFVKGRRHTAVVDLTEATHPNGGYLATPAQVGGGAPAFVLDEDLDK